MMIYHHENMHYEMILLIWFIVIDISPDVDEDIHTVVNMDGMSAVYDDSGNPFLIVLSYKNCISCTRNDNIVTKKIVGDLYMMICSNHFWYCSVLEIVYRYVYMYHKCLSVCYCGVLL